MSGSVCGVGRHAPPRNDQGDHFDRRRYQHDDRLERGRVDRAPDKAGVRIVARRVTSASASPGQGFSKCRSS